MSKNSIWAIIIMMTISLLGITIIQFYRIKWSIDLNEKTFDDKIYMVLNNVKDKLEEDAEETADATRLYSQTFQEKKGALDIVNPQQQNWKYKQQKFKHNSLFNLFNPEQNLQRIDKDKLDAYLKQYLQDQGVDLSYEYGVYAMADKSFYILNGNYAATIGESSESSNVGVQPLTNTEYQVSLFNTEIETPGFLKIFFPQKQSYLWSTVSTLLLSTILFTGLILFCFAYTIFVILRQKKVSEMKTDFINNMTHEFKTPIATISLAADSIINPNIINKEDKVKRFSSIIKAENKRMLNQVEKVLQMAQIDKRDFELNIVQVNMHEIITKAVENSRLQVEKRGGSIHMSLNAREVLLPGDETHLANVVHNLLDNANKYSQEKPEVLVETRNIKEGLEISITDHGIGLTKESIKHIFDKFYRVHTGNIHNVKGFGLGLSYVKAIADAHKGQVNVKSELGKGSTFSLFFPQKGD